MDSNLVIEFQPDDGSNLMNPPAPVLKRIKNAMDLDLSWKPKIIDILNDRTQVNRELKDLESLRKLSSFQAFEKDLQNALNTLTA